MRTTTDRNGSRGLAKQLSWFGALWLGGVLTVAGVAGALRWIMHVL